MLKNIEGFFFSALLLVFCCRGLLFRIYILELVARPTFRASIAQLDRASDYESEGYWFDPSWMRHFCFGFSAHIYKIIGLGYLSAYTSADDF